MWSRQTHGRAAEAAISRQATKLLGLYLPPSGPPVLCPGDDTMILVARGGCLETAFSDRFFRPPAHPCSGDDAAGVQWLEIGDHCRGDHGFLHCWDPSLPEQNASHTQPTSFTCVGDDAAEVQWLEIGDHCEQYRHLYASHKSMIDRVKDPRSV